MYMDWVFMSLQACLLRLQSLRWRQGSMVIWTQCCLRRSRADCAQKRVRRTPGTKVTPLVPLSVTVWVIPTWQHTCWSNTASTSALHLAIQSFSCFLFATALEWPWSLCVCVCVFHFACYCSVVVTIIVDSIKLMRCNQLENVVR